MLDLASFIQHIFEFLRVALEISILTVIIYSVLYFLRGTRGAPVLAGITVIILLSTLISELLRLEVMRWLLTNMWALLAISVLVIFQPEIRRALAAIGSSQVPQQGAIKRQRQVVDLLVETVFFLADRRIGALMAIQQNIGMRALAETGTYINATLSRELLSTFFFPKTPLHDGGVIIKDDMIIAAGCIFPLTQNPDFSRSIGTRHRAGVGITEETDAVAIIVSEETGSVSLAYKGRLLRGLSRERLERHLANYFTRSSKARSHRIFDRQFSDFKGDAFTDESQQRQPKQP